jgi:hypothetical protein
MTLLALATEFHIHPSTISKILREVSSAIWQGMHDHFLPIPDRAMWIRISERFNEKFGFPMTIGAIDGKHFEIEVTF